MRTIGTPPLLRRLVDLDMLHDEIARVETLGICVRFGVFEEAEQELGGFDGPAGFGDAELFAYSTTIPSQYRICILAPGKATSVMDVEAYVPCAVRPVLPAYRLIGTASLCCRTFSRKVTAR